MGNGEELVASSDPAACLTPANTLPAFLLLLTSTATIDSSLHHQQNGNFDNTASFLISVLPRIDAAKAS